MSFRPLHDRVLVRRVKEEEKTKGGIIIPDTAKEKPQEGKVVAVGPGARGDDGKVTPLDVKAGDRILFGKWSGTEVTLDGEELIIMKESDILGIVEKDPGEEVGPQRLTRLSPHPFRREPEPWQPSTYNSPPTPASACCAASTSSPTP